MKQTPYISKVDWHKQFKIRVRRNASNKHEVTKLEIVLKLIEKYKRQLFWIRIYTEYELTNTKDNVKICDVYFENIKTKEIICYEIQNQVSKKWLDETKEFYDNFERIYFKTDWCLIKEKDIPEDLESIENKIKELII